MNRFEVAELGRSRVAVALQTAGFSVTRAPRDGEWCHLIAETPLDTSPPSTLRRRIHVQAATESAFRVWKVWGEKPGLLLAYVWYVAAPAEVEIYALEYPEAEAIVRRLGWASTRSWNDLGGYGTTKAAQHRVLSDLLAPYRMTPSSWWDKVTRVPR